MPPETCPLIEPVTDRLAQLEKTTSYLHEACANHIPGLINALSEKVDGLTSALNGRVQKLEKAFFFVAGLASGLGLLQGIDLLK